MLKRLTYYVVVCSLGMFGGVSLVSQVRAQDATIVIRVVGNTIEIIKTVQDGRKVLKFGYHVPVDKVIYDRLLISSRAN